MPKIDGDPDYSNINTMMQLLYGNATSLPMTLEGGQHGHIGIITTPQLYTTLENTPYDSPPDPGITPTHAIGASAETRQTNFLFMNEEVRLADFRRSSNRMSWCDAVIERTFVGRIRQCGI